MALSGPRLAVTNYTAELFAVTNRTTESRLLFLDNSWSFLNCRVLVALSGQLLAVTNRSVESCWLFLAHVWPEQIVLPSLGGSLWPTFGRNKILLPSLSGSFLPTLGRNKSYCLGGSFWPTFGRNKSYCRVLVAFSGTRLAVTNRTAESWWLFLANSLAVTNRTVESRWLFLANSWP